MLAQHSEATTSKQRSGKVAQLFPASNPPHTCAPEPAQSRFSVDVKKDIKFYRRSVKHTKVDSVGTGTHVYTTLKTDSLCSLSLFD